MNPLSIRQADSRKFPVSLGNYYIFWDIMSVWKVIISEKTFKKWVSPALIDDMLQSQTHPVVTEASSRNDSKILSCSTYRRMESVTSVHVRTPITLSYKSKPSKMVRCYHLVMRRPQSPRNNEATVISFSRKTNRWPNVRFLWNDE